MSTVLSRSTMAGTPPSPVTARGGSIFPTFSEIRVFPDRERRADWVFLKGSGSLHFSAPQLAELVKYQAWACRRPVPPQVQVLASEHSGIFSLGGDLALFLRCIRQGLTDELRAYALQCVDAIFANLSGGGNPDRLSISVVQGEAQGGGFEAALSAHVLIAEKGSRLGFPESLFGMFPGMGARQLLAARTSDRLAAQLIGSARPVDAEALHSEGVVDLLAEPGQGLKAAEALLAGTAFDWAMNCRQRFWGIERDSLVATVEDWIDQAMGLSPSKLRAIEYILQAQARMDKPIPTVRSILRSTI